MDLATMIEEPREQGNPPCDVIKGVKMARMLTMRFGNSIIKGLSEVLLTTLIMLFAKKQVGHRVATLSKNVPVVSNVQQRFSQRIRIREVKRSTAKYCNATLLHQALCTHNHKN